MNTDLEARKAHIRHTRLPRQRQQLNNLVEGPRRRYRFSIVSFLLLAGGTLALLLLLVGCTNWGFAPVTSTPSPAPTLAATGTTAQLPTTTTKADRMRAIYATLTPSACIVENTSGESLNIRKSPSLQAEIIGGLIPGQQVTILIHGETWHQIKAGQLVGYVYSQFCEAEK